VDRTLLSTNNGPQASLFIDNSQTKYDPFFPQEPVALGNHVVTYIDSDPVAPSVIDFGKKITFCIEPQMSRLGPVELVVTVGPLTGVFGGSSASTLNSFHNYVGHHLFSSIVIRYGPNKLQTIYPDQVHIKKMLFLEPKNQLSEAKLVGGSLPASVRQTLALGTQTFVVELPTFWTASTRKWIPVMQLGGRINIEVNMKPLNQLTQCAQVFSSNPVTWSCVLEKIFLRETVLYVPDAHQQEYKNYSINLPLGIRSPFQDIEYQGQNHILSGSANATIQLVDLKGASAWICVLLRNYADVYGNNTNYNDPTGLTLTGGVTLKGMQMTHSSGVVAPYLTRDYILARIVPRFFTGSYGGLMADGITDTQNNFYVIPFSPVPTDENNTLGMQQISTLSNPKLYIDFANATTGAPANLTSDAMIDVFSFTWNETQIAGQVISTIFQS